MDKSLLILLLLFCKDKEPVYGKTRLIKLMYIAKRKTEYFGLPIDFYDFDKYYYGPFCKTLLNDLDALIKKGYVKHEMKLHGHPFGFYEENVYEITDEGMHFLENIFKKIPYLDKLTIIFEGVKKKYNNMPLFMLIHEVYTKYPMAI